jgi:flavin reductase (DIM6/NTAB) family NADH-FMN oxidoreductase RutF
MKQKEVIPAESGWIEKSVREFSGSPFERIDSQWMLITAGDVENDKANWNTMTASWGGLGVLWNKDVAFIFIRPSRRTFGFANDSSVFTLSFFDEAFRPALNLCGEKSGRDTDKAAAAGLTPVFFQSTGVKGAISFNEAREILFCKKIYSQDLDPALFLDASIEKNYNGNDYHRLFIGEILAYKSR